jgi:hypothetical protein
LGIFFNTTTIDKYTSIIDNRQGQTEGASLGRGRDCSSSHHNAARKPPEKSINRFRPGLLFLFWSKLLRAQAKQSSGQGDPARPESEKYGGSAISDQSRAGKRQAVR